MIEGGNFSINSQTKPTNQDMTVVFSPSINTVKYSYTVYKDGKVLNTAEIINNKPSNIYFDETGSYHISVTSYDINGKPFVNNSGMYIIDKQAPILNVSDTYIETFKGDDNTLAGIEVSATDNHDGDITSNITSSEIDLSHIGVQKLTYTVSDMAGNTTSKTVNVNVVGSFSNMLLLQISVVVLLLLLVIPIIRVWKTFKLDKRLDAFTIDTTRVDTTSVFDRLFDFYHKLIDKIIKLFKGSVFVSKYAKKFDKYVPVNVLHNSGMEIFAGKILLSFTFVFIAIVQAAIRFKMITIYEIVLPLIIGFFVFDIIYFIKYKMFRGRLENDFLSAIIIMNNAFKSGRSISQAIDLVGNEMDGKIGREFRKMSLELSYGLGIDVIFKRFAERVKLEEVNYLTASLTILNKTGGNIVQVFGAIEKTLFNKKKLRLELKSLTGSSKIIVYVLFAVPFFFVLFISVINPNYFMPFITTDLGKMLLGFMLIYYAIFIICVRKIMKVVI